MAELKAVALPTSARGFLVGGTGTGKTTLAERLIQTFQTSNPTAKILILDSKPRFRAEWQVNGISAARLYKKWGYGGFFPGSYVLPLVDPSSELRAVWRSGGHVAIAQVERKSYVEALRIVASRFYEDYGARIPRLVYVDEVADFYDGSGRAAIDDPIQAIARAGRERNVSLLVATQRPKGVPKSLLTEMSQLYMFGLDWRDDQEHLRDMGLPDDAPYPEWDHSFLFWDKRLKGREPSLRVYKLEKS